MSTERLANETQAQTALNLAKQILKETSDTATLDAELIMMHTLDCSRLELYTLGSRQLSRQQRQQFATGITERKAGKPVAYILGHKDFWKHQFEVNSSVLIPRPDTELLVEKAIGYLSELKPGDNGPVSILDVGTGSGCIAISLALEFPDTHVDAWDLSRDALKTATSNQRRLGSKVNFIRKDALSPDSWKGSQDYHLIVSNPPYIAENESSLMPVDVKDWEPTSALFAPDQGLAFYRTMAECAPALLQGSGGCIMMEIGFQQGPAVEAIFKRKLWNNVTTFKDLAGHDRLVVAHRSLKS